MEKLGLAGDAGAIQNTVMLETARILRKVLEIYVKEKFSVSSRSIVMTCLTSEMTTILTARG